jgi:hypothetical protein
MRTPFRLCIVHILTRRLGGFGEFVVSFPAGAGGTESQHRCHFHFLGKLKTEMSNLDPVERHALDVPVNDEPNPQVRLTHLGGDLLSPLSLLLSVRGGHLCLSPRLRPIIITSTTFVPGVFPLVSAYGARADMRHTLGAALSPRKHVHRSRVEKAIFLNRLIGAALRSTFEARIAPCSDVYRK